MIRHERTQKPTFPDQWAAAATYEFFMGRWSRTLAHVFVEWLGPDAGLHWLDIGCGTGALTAALCSDADPASVTACDPTEPFLQYARQSIKDRRASFVAATAEDFPMRAGGYDAIASLLALNFFPAPAAALARMRSASVTRGLIAAAVWDYAGDMQFLRYFWDAASEIDDAASQLDEGVRFPLCNHDALLELFRTAGLVDIRCEALDIVTEFASFDDYWSPFLGGTGPAPSFVASLDPQRRELLRENLEQRLARAPNVAIRLRARAWAVRGNAS